MLPSAPNRCAERTFVQVWRWRVSSLFRCRERTENAKISSAQTQKVVKITGDIANKIAKSSFCEKKGRWIYDVRYSRCCRGISIVPLPLSFFFSLSREATSITFSQTIIKDPLKYLKKYSNSLIGWRPSGAIKNSGRMKAVLKTKCPLLREKTALFQLHLKDWNYVHHKSQFSHCAAQDLDIFKMYGSNLTTRIYIYTKLFEDDLQLSSYDIV